MANFTAANLAKAQAKMTQMFNSGELRYRTPATFLEFVKSRDIMIPSHNVLRTREDRVVEANYFLRTSRALGSARAHNHTGARGDSSVLIPSWSTYADDFKISLKQADNNVYALEEMLAYEYGQVVTNFAEGLETAAINYLFNNRSQVNGVTSQGTFDGVDFAFEIAEANEDRAVQITKTVMDILKYQGVPYTFFCDSISYSKFEKFANQGTGNSTNLSFQFSNVTFVKSFELDALAAGLVSAYAKGFWIAVPQGHIAALDWIPKQNRQGIITKENMYGTLLNPVDGLLYATHSYEERSDESASNGYTQDVKTEIEVSIDIALEHAPLSTANETPLQAFAIV